MIDDPRQDDATDAEADGLPPGTLPDDTIEAAALVLPPVDPATGDQPAVDEDTQETEIVAETPPEPEPEPEPEPDPEPPAPEPIPEPEPEPAPPEPDPVPDPIPAPSHSRLLSPTPFPTPSPTRALRP